MEMNWELCRIFYQVARCRNFSRAAAVLFTSQPAVSRAMATLERELGCRLFIRNRRGVELTPEGRLFYAHVAAGRAQFRRGREELEQAVGLQSGSITLGASGTALHYWLLPRLNRFHAQYPGVKLHLFEGTSRQVVGEVISGAIDFAVAAVPDGSFRALKVTCLSTFRDVFVASSAFDELRDKVVTLEEIMRHPFICHRQGTLTYEFLEHQCKARGVDFAPDMEPGSTPLVLELVRHGLGIGFLPEPGARAALAAGEVFALRLDRETPPRSISLLEYDSHSLSTAARRLRDMLVEDGDKEKNVLREGGPLSR